VSDLEIMVLELLVTIDRPATTKEIAGRLKLAKEDVHKVMVALRKANKIQFVGKEYGWQLRG
jgi:predicted transcriptional regulator